MKAAEFWDELASFIRSHARPDVDADKLGATLVARHNTGPVDGVWNFEIPGRFTPDGNPLPFTMPDSEKPKRRAARDWSAPVSGTRVDGSMKCINSEPGWFNGECGRPAEWVGEKPTGYKAAFCDRCKADGWEARHFPVWLKL